MPRHVGQGRGWVPLVLENDHEACAKLAWMRPGRPGWLLSCRHGNQRDACVERFRQSWPCAVRRVGGVGHTGVTCAGRRGNSRGAKEPMWSGNHFRSGGSCGGGAGGGGCATAGGCEPIAVATERRPEVAGTCYVNRSDELLDRVRHPYQLISQSSNGLDPSFFLPEARCRARVVHP